jgi:putative heme-binding domain-containing protein
VGWKGDRIDVESEFVASSDTWFRPVQFANAPDGCLYILDFYREVIEHPQSLPDSIKRHLDLTNGRDRGRIYRLRDARRPVQYRNDIGSYSTDQLIETLIHPNSWHRETARRLLWSKLSMDLDSSESQRYLDRINSLTTKRTESPSEQGRAGGLNGLGLMAQAKRLPGELDFWLEHQDANVRMAAIRLLEPLAIDHPELRKRLYGMASDADIGVRFQLALSMSLLPTKEEDLAERRFAIRSLLDQMTSDTAYRAAVANLMEPHAAVFMRECLSDLTPISGAGQGGAVQPARPSSKGGALEVLGYCFASVASVEELREFDQSWGRIVGASDNDWNGHLLRGVLDGLSIKRGFVLDSLNEYPAIQASVSELVKSSLLRLRNLEQPLEQRIDAMRALRWAPEQLAVESYYSLLSPTYPIAIQEKALEGLGAYHDPSIAAGILERYRAFTPTMRFRAIDLLIRRPVWLDELLNQLEQGRVNWDDFSTSQRTALRNHSNQNVRDRIAGYFETADTDRSKIISQYQNALSLSGNVTTGQGLFVKLCSACHKADGVGYEVGPNLIAFRYRGPEAILQNVLDPNREVNPMYLSYNVMTNDETTISGMIESESTEVVNLTRGGEFRDAVPRSKITEMKSSRVSIMPEGFENQLDQQAMADLLAYLMQLR